jgi:hypothetical protein
MFTKVVNPKWNDFHKNTIFCKVEIDNSGNIINYVASKFDTVKSGKLLYDDLVNNRYGEIAPYSVIAPKVPLADIITRTIKRASILSDAVITQIYTSKVEEAALNVIINIPPEKLAQLAATYNMSVPDFEKMVKDLQQVIVDIHLALVSFKNSANLVKAENDLAIAIDIFAKSINISIKTINEYRTDKKIADISLSI